MVLLKEFLENVDFEKHQQTTKKHEKLPRGQNQVFKCQNQIGQKTKSFRWGVQNEALEYRDHTCFFMH